jgi:hypothetical protein
MREETFNDLAGTRRREADMKTETKRLERNQEEQYTSQFEEILKGQNKGKIKMRGCASVCNAADISV